MALVIPIILTQCSDKDLSEIIVSDAIMYVPIEGSPMTAGYLTVTNRSDASVDIEGINCNSIRAEIHDISSTDTGVMKMGKMNTYSLKSGSSLVLEPGGKHVMAWGLQQINSEYVDCSVVVSDADPVKFKFLLKDRG